MLAIGLDIGTANLRMAAVISGAPTLIADSDGARSIPAVVSFSRAQVRIGATALRRAALHPDETVRAIKRQLGEAEVRIGGEKTTPQLVLSLLIEHLVEVAAGRLGARPTSAVVCRPAWFDAGQHRALEEAVAAAGLRVQRVILEPTAVALGLAVGGTEPQRVAVVDVGAGGASVAFFAVGPRKVELLACAGDGRAAGDDLDAVLVGQMLHELQSQVEGLSPGDPRLEMLRQSCERMKHDLAQADSTSAPASYLQRTDGAPVVLSLTRARLEAALGSILGRVETCCRQALAEAGLLVGDADALYLVGGTARLEAVRDRLEKVIGRAAEHGFDPQEAVVLGASVLADSLEREAEPIQVDESVAEHFGTNREEEPADVRPAAPPVQRVAVAPQTPPAVQPRAEPSRPLPAPGPDREPPPTARGAANADSRESRRSAAVAVAPRSVSRGPASSAGLPREIGSGRAYNPRDFGELLDLPFSRGLRPEECDPIALPVLLLRQVARREVMGTLTLETERKSVSMLVMAGRPHLKPQERAALCQAFVWPELRYEFDDTQPDPRGLSRVGMVRLVVEGLKTWGRTFSAEEMSAALGERLNLAPVMRVDHLHALPRLGLDQRELRLIELQMDGTLSAAELAHRGVGAHTTLQLLGLLTAFGFLEWRAVEVEEGASRAEQLEKRADQMDRGNHFDVLTVHWTASVEEIRAAYDKLCQELGEGTPEHAAAPEACARIRERARVALKVLGDPRQLIRYRRETFPEVDFEALDDFMLKRIQALDLHDDKRELTSAKRTREEITATSTYKVKRND